MKHRIFCIDFFRALAIVIVMITHTLALYLGPAIINVIWNYLHFVVPTLVFCSGYVVSSWNKKRVFRLYIPYAIYVLIYITIHKIPVFSSFFLKSITLIGGVDIGWLTLLFLQLWILTPVFQRLLRNTKHTIAVLLLLEIISFGFLFFKLPSRFVAFIPWSLVYIAGMYFRKNNLQVKNIGSVGIITFGLWLLMNILPLPKTLTLHKYPPDIFYLLYAISMNCLLLSCYRLWRHPGEKIKKVITFISIHSYEFFFLHLLILQLLPWASSFFRSIIFRI